MAKTGSWQVQGSPWAHSGLEDRGGGACQEATAKSGFFYFDRLRTPYFNLKNSRRVQIISCRLLDK